MPRSAASTSMVSSCLLYLALAHPLIDLMGCGWNIPGDYGDGFTNCEGDSTIPMGLYPQPDGTTSTFRQGQPKSPPAHPAASTSLCTTLQSFAVGTSAIRTGVPTTSKPAATGTETWTTGTPTGTAASSTNSAALGTGFGAIGMALTSVVVGALGAGLYLL
jgi:hypothetical protein